MKKINKQTTIKTKNKKKTQKSKRRSNGLQLSIIYNVYKEAKKFPLYFAGKIKI